MLVGCIYRRNGRIDATSPINTLQHITVSHSNIVLAGDFNSNILHEKHLVDHMMSLGLSVCNSTIPTHFTSSSSTLLDLFFIDRQDKVLFHDQLSAEQYSRHDLIYLSYNFHLDSILVPSTFPDFNSINYSELLEATLQVEWNHIYAITSVDDQVLFLESNLVNLFENHVPIKTVRNHKSCPWLTPQIKSLMNQRNIAYLRWKSYKTPEYLSPYKSLRNMVIKNIRAEKTKHFENKFSGSINSKQKWSQIKRMNAVPTKNRAVDIADLNLNEINCSFVNFDTPNFLAIPTPVHSPNTVNPNTCFYFHGVDQYDVLQAILSVKSNAVGLNKVHPTFLKALLPIVLPYITYIFNNFLSSSDYPSSWKQATVVPVSKPSGGLRPIAVLGAVH